MGNAVSIFIALTFLLVLAAIYFAVYIFFKNTFVTVAHRRLKAALTAALVIAILLFGTAALLAAGFSGLPNQT